MQRLAFFLIFLGLTKATVCPEGWTDDQKGNCISQSFSAQAQWAARRACLTYNGYLLYIQNAFENSNYLSFIPPKSVAWIGLNCLNNSTTSCIWDNGKTMKQGDFQNFEAGHPNPDIGPCVFMDTTTGKWKSIDCTMNRAYYACQYTPGVLVQDCQHSYDTETQYLNGRCYDVRNFTTADDTITGCRLGGDGLPKGEAASIHTPGENSAVRDLGGYWLDNESEYDSYFFIGLKQTVDGYTWSDGSQFNFNKLASDGTTQNGVCTVIQTNNRGNVGKGEWMNMPCNSVPPKIFYGHVLSICEYASSGPVAAPAIDCSAPINLATNDQNPVGKIYSPGFPSFTSTHSVCKYVITVHESVAYLEFDRMLIDSLSSLKIYDGTAETGRLMDTITNVTKWPSKYAATGKVMTLIFTSNGKYATIFHGTFEPKLE